MMQSQTRQKNGHPRSRGAEREGTALFSKHIKSFSKDEQSALKQMDEVYRDEFMTMKRADQELVASQLMFELKRAETVPEHTYYEDYEEEAVERGAAEAEVEESSEEEAVQSQEYKQLVTTLTSIRGREVVNTATATEPMFTFHTSFDIILQGSIASIVEPLSQKKAKSAFIMQPDGNWRKHVFLPPTTEYLSIRHRLKRDLDTVFPDISQGIIKSCRVNRFLNSFPIPITVQFYPGKLRKNEVLTREQREKMMTDFSVLNPKMSLDGASKYFFAATTTRGKYVDVNEELINNEKLLLDEIYTKYAYLDFRTEVLKAQMHESERHQSMYMILKGETSVLYKIVSEKWKPLGLDDPSTKKTVEFHGYRWLDPYPLDQIQKILKLINKQIFNHIHKVDLSRTAFCFKRLDGKNWDDLELAEEAEYAAEHVMMVNVDMEIAYPRFFVESINSLNTTRDDLLKSILEPRSPDYSSVPSEEDF